MEHFEGNGLLSDPQRGFRHMGSCETQLLQFVDDLARGVCNGNQFDLAIMDFSKAFDVIFNLDVLRAYSRIGQVCVISPQTVV